MKHSRPRTAPQGLRAVAAAAAGRTRTRRSSIVSKLGNSEGGKLQLSKPNGEEEILIAALKGGVPYYRLQKFTATVERERLKASRLWAFRPSKSLASPVFYEFARL